MIHGQYHNVIYFWPCPTTHITIFVIGINGEWQNPDYLDRAGSATGLDLSSILSNLVLISFGNLELTLTPLAKTCFKFRERLGFTCWTCAKLFVELKTKKFRFGSCHWTLIVVFVLFVFNAIREGVQEQWACAHSFKLICVAQLETGTYIRAVASWQPEFDSIELALYTPYENITVNLIRKKTVFGKLIGYGHFLCKGWDSNEGQTCKQVIVYN